MTKDYETYLKNKGNLSQLVNAAYEQYKFFIMKKAALYEKCSKGRILSEDFTADVYEKLFYFIGRLNEEKMNPESFSFYLSIRYAVFKQYYAERKRVDAELLLLNDEDHENSFAAERSQSETTVDVAAFYTRLTPRQKAILTDKQNGVHENVTRANLKISHGTYTGDIHRAKKTFAQFI